MRTPSAKYEKDFPRRKGEVPLKWFVAELGKQLGIGWHGAYYHFRKMDVGIRRINKRVVYVRQP